MCVCMCLCVLPEHFVLSYSDCKTCQCCRPRFNHFPSLSVPSTRKEWMEKDCISFQQTVTLWVSVEHAGVQEGNRQLLVSSLLLLLFFFVLIEWMVVAVEVAAVDGGMVRGRSVTWGEVHPRGVKFRKRARAGRGGAWRERGEMRVEIV